VDIAAFKMLSLERVEDGILLVRMNRPESANALNTAMGLELVTCFESIGMEPSSWRCIILTGSGERVFCAGGDLKERDGMTEPAWRAQHLIFERMARAIINCPVPVIAAVNGSAYGGGCEIAACCDFIYAAQNARFAMPEARLGIIPGAGGTQTLARSIGERRAKETILSAEPFDASAALAWGFVNKVLSSSDLLDATIARARLIAANAPLAVRQAKQSIQRGLQMSLSDGLAFEIEAYNRLVATADRTEGVRAFNEKRAPQFKGE
jgi:enoyl-CoA hydratase/carnithine racemase